MLLWGNPNPKWSCNYLLSSRCPEYDPEEFTPSSDWGSGWWLLPSTALCTCHLNRSQGSSLWSGHWEKVQSISEAMWPCPGICKEGHASPGIIESRYYTWWILGTGLHWVKPGLYGYIYLRVFADTIMEWKQSFPSWVETVQVVAKKLLVKIIPRFGFPLSLGSDNS